MICHPLFQVASVSWYKKKAAAALFASPPESTYEIALEHFKDAERCRSSCHPRLNIFLPLTMQERFLNISCLILTNAESSREYIIYCALRTLLALHSARLDSAIDSCFVTHIIFYSIYFF